MATLFRRRDEHDQEDGVTKDADGFRTTNDRPQDTSLQEPGAKIWMPYLELADKYDKDLVHNWRDDMDSLLIFAALFSASVTAFVIESYNNLVQDTGEVTISVLLQISQQIANGTQAAAVRPPFQAASIDIAVNVLWFLSLAFSLTCALAAVLVRQWARQYLRFPRSFSSTSEQARARQFVFENMEWWKMDVIVEMIPALLHISLILFFIGLLLFVRAVSYTLAAYLLCFCAIGGAAYALLTTTPLVFSGCPYKTPFTGLLGLWIKGGTPLFRVIWIGLSTFIACVVVTFYTTLGLLTHRCFPSINLSKPTWAVKRSAPITSHLERTIRFLHHTHSFLVLAVDSVKRATRAFSVTLTERQQVYRDELTIRDAHALEWAMEYSKRDTDLLDILSSVPEFVELNNSSAEVHTIMRQSGVLSRAVRLLRSLAINGDDPTSKSVCVACLEVIVFVTSQTTERDSRDLGTVDLSSLIKTFVNGEVPQFQMDNDIAHLAVCAISNIVLHRLYELENSVLEMTGEDEFNQKAQKLQSAVSDIISLLYDKFSSFSWYNPQSHWSPWRNFELEHHLLTLMCGKSLSWSCVPTSSIKAFCNSLRTFRSAWVTAWMKYYVSSPPPTHRGIWRSLCDSMTHLLPFPCSTRMSQHVIFMLSDKFVQMDFSELDGQFLTMWFAYSGVLYANQSPLLNCYSRAHLHAHFTRSVRVVGGKQVENSGEVEIPFDEYTAIINELALFVPKFAYELNESGHHSDLPVDSPEFLDASALAIQKMIHCRIQADRPEEELSIVLDAQHLSAVRTLRSYSDVWQGLIDRTAAEFDYIYYLYHDYNIDVHAELQFYDPDLFLFDVPELECEWSWESSHREDWDGQFGCLQYNISASECVFK